MARNAGTGAVIVMQQGHFQLVLPASARQTKPLRLSAPATVPHTPHLLAQQRSKWIDVEAAPDSLSRARAPIRAAGCRWRRNLARTAESTHKHARISTILAAGRR